MTAAGVKVAGKKFGTTFGNDKFSLNTMASGFLVVHPALIWNE
jgi:hypothetical protein